MRDVDTVALRRHLSRGGGVPKPVRTFAAGLKWPGVLSTPPAPRPGQSIAAAFCGCNATAVLVLYYTGTGTTIPQIAAA